jgi:hypothetical protein
MRVRNLVSPFEGRIYFEVFKMQTFATNVITVFRKALRNSELTALVVSCICICKEVHLKFNLQHTGS